MKRFTRIDGENFGACLKQIFDIKNYAVFGWRIRKSDNAACIIEYHEQGRGYFIYSS